VQLLFEQHLETSDYAPNERIQGFGLVTPTLYEPIALRFVVEAELTSAQLWYDLSSRDRARQVFAAEGVWNTAENNGVLIYLMLADRRVEIVADRGIDAKVQPAEWEGVCRMMEGHFREGRYEAGALAGIDAVSQLLSRHFPGTGPRANELEDRPRLI